ncbi:MAG: rhamnose/proton symporter RhaT [Bacteroidales bacterium]|nr:rhamnose/proton symporter RhaT [Bacteroidales bacterium]
MILIGLFIIMVGAFCQASSYVPINKIKEWSWESYWIVQGVFAWLVFPLLGALLAVTGGHSLMELYTADPKATFLTIFFGMLWGVGGLTFGLSMRYLGVALGQSIALGICSALGVIMTPVMKGLINGNFGVEVSTLTAAVIIGVIVSFIGIIIIGLAGSMRAKEDKGGEKKEEENRFNFGKGIVVALISGFMSACFSIGQGFGSQMFFPDTKPVFQGLPAVLLVTIGGFIVNACYCFFQNSKNKTWGDYKKGNLWGHNLVFCALAGILWYSQFFGLSLGRGFLQGSATLMAFSWCILMSLDVVFSNVWGIILKEWKGTSKKTVAILVIGLAILVISTFLPELLK